MMQWMKMKKIGKAGGITMDKVQVKVKGKAIFIVELIIDILVEISGGNYGK